MDFESFKQKYLKAPVEEYPNECDPAALVSVRLMAYNHRDYVAQCLDSILAQETDFDFNIVLAEDDSSDGTREICLEYAKKHPDKIRLLLGDRRNNIKVNGKPTGIFNSTYTNYSIDSKYIAICEADDYWTDPKSLQKRADYLEQHDDHVMCFHDAIGIREGQSVKEGKNFLPWRESVSIEKEEMIERVIPTASVMYRHKLIEVFSVSMTEIMLGDMLLRGKLSVYGKGRYIHDIKPSVYRYHDGGMYSALPLAERMELTFQTRKYLIKHIADSEERKQSMTRSLAVKYLGFFFGMLKFERRLNWKFIKQNRYYARQSETPMFHIAREWFYTKTNH